MGSVDFSIIFLLFPVFLLLAVLSLSFLIRQAKPGRQSRSPSWRFFLPRCQVQPYFFFLPKFFLLLLRCGDEGEGLNRDRWLGQRNSPFGGGQKKRSRDFSKKPRKGLSKKFLVLLSVSVVNLKLPPFSPSEKNMQIQLCQRREESRAPHSPTIDGFILGNSQDIPTFLTFF